MLGLLREELPETRAGSGATVLIPPVRWTQPGKMFFCGKLWDVFRVWPLRKKACG